MKTAIIHGNATATVKHPSFTGQTLLIAVPEGGGAPQIVVDPLGAGLGARVLMTSDGSEARTLLHDLSSPARWSVCAILDPVPDAKEAQP
ncbi:MAG: EutN/CcmL family microcompartment protein [Chthoniobacteraceae bacterium]